MTKTSYFSPLLQKSCTSENVTTQRVASGNWRSASEINPTCQLSAYVPLLPSSTPLYGCTTTHLPTHILEEHRLFPHFSFHKASRYNIHVIYSELNFPWTNALMVQLLDSLISICSVSCMCMCVKTKEHSYQNLNKIYVS